MQVQASKIAQCLPDMIREPLATSAAQMYTIAHEACPPCLNIIIPEGQRWCEVHGARSTLYHTCVIQSSFLVERVHRLDNQWEQRAADTPFFF